MATETEIERLVVRLIGDASSYQKMLTDADKSTQQTMTSIQKMGKNIEAVQKQLERVGAGVTRFGQSLRGMGTAASLAITTPITALAGVATNEFNNFESALSRMKGLVGLADDEIKGFKEDILKLAVATGKAPIELAQAMENITSSGVQGQAALETLTVSARAAAGGLGEVRSVSDTVTSAMNAYGVANLSATKATDILVAAVREGKAEAETFAPVLGNVLPIANEMGISFDEAAGSIAYLTLATGSASTAATQYQNILAQTIKMNAKHDAGKLLIGAGIDIEGFKKDVTSSGLQPALMKLKESLAKVGLTLKDAFPDVQAMTAALQLTGANAAKAASVIENVGKAAGSVDTAFNAAAETTKFKLNQSMAEMKVILIELGEIIAPIFSNLTNWLGQAMQAWKVLTPESKRWVVTILSIVAAIGPLLVGIGTFIALTGSVITGLGTIIGLFGSLLSVINPVTLAITGLAVFLVTQTDIMGKALQWFGQQWQSLLDYVQPAIDGIKAALGKGDLELAVRILWAQIKLAWFEGTQALKEEWIIFNEAFVRIGADAVAAYLNARAAITNAAEIAEIKLRYSLTDDAQSRFAMSKEIAAVNERHNVAMKAIKDEHAATIKAAEDASDEKRQFLKDDITSLKAERDALTDVAVTDPLIRESNLKGSGLTPESNPALEEANKELDKLQKKGDVKISLKFDAAKSGSAEAMARIAEYKAMAGQVVRTGVDKSLKESVKKTSKKKDVLPEGLGDFKDPVQSLKATDTFMAGDQKTKNELLRAEQDLIKARELRQIEKDNQAAMDHQANLAPDINFGGMPSLEEVRKPKGAPSGWEQSKMILEKQLQDPKYSDETKNVIKEELQKVVDAINRKNEGPVLTLADAGFK